MPGAAGPGSLGEAVGEGGNATDPAAELRGAPAGACGQSAHPSRAEVHRELVAAIGSSEPIVQVVAHDGKLYLLAQGLDTTQEERARSVLAESCRGCPGWHGELVSLPGRSFPPQASKPRLFLDDPLGR